MPGVPGKGEETIGRLPFEKTGAGREGGEGGTRKKRFALPRDARLRERAAFVRAFKDGARTSGKWLTLYAVANGGGKNRLGVSVGRKYGKAFSRNRIRRLLKEVFRLEAENLPRGFDIVCIPRRDPAKKTFEEVRALFLGLARSADRKAARKGTGEEKGGTRGSW